MDIVIRLRQYHLECTWVALREGAQVTMVQSVVEGAARVVTAAGAAANKGGK
jgi:hypothetical protein